MDGITFIAICTLAAMAWGGACAFIDYRAARAR